jgi:hypothetical protein
VVVQKRTIEIGLASRKCAQRGNGSRGCWVLTLILYTCLARGIETGWCEECTLAVEPVHQALDAVLGNSGTTYWDGVTTVSSVGVETCVVVRSVVNSRGTPAATSPTLPGTTPLMTSIGLFRCAAASSGGF